MLQGGAACGFCTWSPWHLVRICSRALTIFICMGGQAREPSVGAGRADGRARCFFLHLFHSARASRCPFAAGHSASRFFFDNVHLQGADALYPSNPCADFIAHDFALSISRVMFVLPGGRFCCLSFALAPRAFWCCANFGIHPIHESLLARTFDL